jgi:hypothetical protein
MRSCLIQDRNREDTKELASLPANGDLLSPLRLDAVPASRLGLGRGDLRIGCDNREFPRLVRASFQFESDAPQFRVQDLMSASSVLAEMGWPLRVIV